MANYFQCTVYLIFNSVDQPISQAELSFYEFIGSCWQHQQETEDRHESSFSLRKWQRRWSIILIALPWWHTHKGKCCSVDSCKLSLRTFSVCNVLPMRLVWRLWPDMDSGIFENPINRQELQTCISVSIHCKSESVCTFHARVCKLLGTFSPGN
jgi:hypothetical protein